MERTYTETEIRKVRSFRLSRFIHATLNEVLVIEFILVALAIGYEHFSGRDIEIVVTAMFRALGVVTIAAFVAAVVTKSRQDKLNNLLFGSMLDDINTYIKTLFDSEREQHESMSIICALLDSVISERQTGRLLDYVQIENLGLEKRIDNGRGFMLEIIHALAKIRRVPRKARDTELFTPEGERIYRRLLDAIADDCNFE